MTIILDKVEYKGKEYFCRDITIFKGTDGEKTVSIADDALSTEIYANQDEDCEVDQCFAGYLPIDDITKLSDRKFAKVVEEVIYNNEP